MPKFNIVRDASEIHLSARWKNALKINSNERLVNEQGKPVAADYAGRRYQLIAKQQRKMTCLERFGRGFLATLAVVFSLGLALLSKSVFQLYTKSMISKRFVVLAPPAAPKNGPQGKIPRPAEHSTATVTPKVAAVPATPEPDPATPNPVTPDPVTREILEKFTPQMVEALGGVEVVRALPSIKGWQGTIEDPQSLTAPVMVGERQGSPYLLFCYLRYHEETQYDEEWWTVLVDYLQRTEKGWKGAYPFPRELNLNLQSSEIVDNSETAKHMLDRIQRLMTGKPIGSLKTYENPYEEPSKRKPPQDTYLEGDALTTYMQTEAYSYERKPKEGTTDLFLWDPTKSTKENLQAVYEKFPQQKVRQITRGRAPRKTDPQEEIQLPDDWRLDEKK